MHILLANEPRTYREVMAAAFRRLRPEFAVTTVAPDDLDQLVEQLVPGLVMCSRLTALVEQHTRAWVVLSPDPQTPALISIENERTTVIAVELEELLAVIDRAWHVATNL